MCHPKRAECSVLRRLRVTRQPPAGFPDGFPAGFLLGFRRGFIDQQDGNVVPDRVNPPAGPALQALPAVLGPQLKRLPAGRANQYVEQILGNHVHSLRQKKGFKVSQVSRFQRFKRYEKHQARGIGFETLKL